MKKKNLLMAAIAIFGFATISMAQNVRAWGTYYTGTGQVWPNGEDRGQACITDAAGNVYMVGTTNSNSDIATVGAHQTICAGGDTIGGFSGTDAFLVKFNSSGVRQWATYYGGSEWDYGTSCAIDASGNIYMIGSTSSTSGIATAGAHETTVNDGFLVKFNSSGVRQWGTYFEGNGNACTTDASGNIYIVGLTNSTSGIATAGAHQTVMSGSGDAFLVKFNSSGVKQWGTYFGGASSGASGMEKGLSCATDALGNVYMVGQTPSTSGIATAGAHQTIYGGSSTDAFLVKFNSSGVRQWATYYGGPGVDIGYSCVTDASGNIYLAGDTQQEFLPASSGMTTIGAHQSAYGGGYSDGFLVKFDSNGLRQWGTYYGGSLLDVSFSCATDASGNVYMSGNTQSSSGIATAGAHQTTVNSAFLVKFNSSGVRQSGTYYGGIKNVCTSDASGNVYMTGYTQSNSGIATAGAHQTANGNNGYSDAFLVKFSGCLSPSITVNSGAICAGQSFTINPNGANTYTIQGGNAVVNPSINTTYTVIGTSTAGCVSQAVATSSLIVNANPTITVNSGFICAGENFTIYPNGANTYSIQGGNAVVSPTINVTYTVAGTNSAGCVSQTFATSSLTVNQCVGITNQTMGIGGVSIYPNPNNGEFTIELVSISNTYITIKNVLGQIIKTQKAEFINQINLNLFEKGVYFITVMDNNQSVYRASLIKQ